MKLGWRLYIQNQMKKVRKIYHAFRIISKKIPTSLIKIRRKFFFAYALPHLIWLFSCWFFFTETQQRTIEHTYCTGLKITYTMNLWDDITVYSLTREYTLNDYIFKYWVRFNRHLEIAPEALQYQLSFGAYLAAKSHDRYLYRSMCMRKNNKFFTRLSLRAHHSKIDVYDCLHIHYQQYVYYRNASFPIHFFIYKYLLTIEDEQ